ncbi:hypothetical protein N6H14_32320 [Paenibacillus sp. CC-CFT747]|nr:hypothetical protein N6H14_32320 [Paenibacillus sp. CC-CFT747]
MLTDLILLLIGFGFAFLFSFIVSSPWRRIFKQYGSHFMPSSPSRIYDESALFGEG